jgi:iron(III) transport system ATP-binding protein
VRIAAAGGNGHAGGGLMGRVLSAKFLGDAVRYEVGIEGFDAPLNVRTVAGETFAKGSEVRVHIDPGEVLVFPSNGDKTP